MLFRACKQARNYLNVTVRVGAFYATAAHELSMVVSLDEKEVLSLVLFIP